MQNYLTRIENKIRQSALRVENKNINETKFLDHLMFQICVWINERYLHLNL